MKREHVYTHSLKWEGDTSISSISNDRIYSVDIKGKPVINGSADKIFHGNEALYNPEDMLLAALSSCHMMSFLYVCRKKGVKVKGYKDCPVGILKLNADGSGGFEKVTLKPKVIFLNPIEEGEILGLHKEAGKLCFIANSCSFAIAYEL